MGIGTLRRYHDPESAPAEGVAVAVDGETAEPENRPAKASGEAGVGSGIAKGKKTAPRAEATLGNGGSE